MSETLVNKTQAGDGIWTQDNLLAGNNISITQVQKPVIDEHTLALWHFDNTAIDTISNLAATAVSSFVEGKFDKAAILNTAYSTSTIIIKRAYFIII